STISSSRSFDFSAVTATAPIPARITFLILSLNFSIYPFSSLMYTLVYEIQTPDPRRSLHYQPVSLFFLRFAIRSGMLIRALLRFHIFLLVSLNALFDD